MSVAGRGLVDRAAETLATGRPIIVTAGAGPSSVADIVIAGQHAGADCVAWAVRYTSGFLCAAMSAGRADKLNLPALRGDGLAKKGIPAYGVGVDAAAGIGTGISAVDRAHTVRVLAESGTGPDDLTRPGHVVPIRTAERGVLQQRGAAEAAVDLCIIGGLAPVAITATLLTDAGHLLQGDELAEFADRHQIEMVTVDSVAHHVLRHGTSRRGRLRRLVEQPVNLGVEGPFLIDFADEVTGATHTVMIGHVGPGQNPGQIPKVHVVTACARWQSESEVGDGNSPLDLEADGFQVTEQGGMIIALRDTPELFMAEKFELARGAVVAALRHFGVSRAWVIGWPDGSDRGASRLIDCGPDPKHRRVAAS